MKSLILAYFILGLFVNAAVWWATDVTARGESQLRKALQLRDMARQMERQGRVVWTIRKATQPCTITATSAAT